MEAFWSGTDAETIEDFDTERLENNWFISLVTNHKADTKIRVDIFQSLRCTIEDIVWDISFDEQDKAIKENALDEIMEKVEIISHKTKGFKKSTNWTRGNGFNYDEDGHPIFEYETNRSVLDDKTNLLKLKSSIL